MNKAIEKSRVLFLDTGAVVRLLQMHPDYYPVVSSVLDYAYENNLTVLVSDVTLFEISKKAFAAGEGLLSRQYREFFEHSRNVKPCEVTGEIAVKAAELATKNLTTEESLRLATAFVCGADCILTDSAAFTDLTDIPVVLLDDVE
ncbi:PIN domain-containing protein [Fibrobacter sp. UWB10]|uniref:type II toxin-antitoxin system VapC family toxin n=1 Tax=Fibrobacter sp. UWB10 TaxID=1896201 RepID=UPI0024034931|nr:PIN domain-containing protein [Fibrobacter sp. UWB10]SMP48160.1 PIN domain-containing protein [Fibrobacter sp. UWB10]